METEGEGDGERVPCTDDFGVVVGVERVEAERWEVDLCGEDGEEREERGRMGS